MNPDHELLRRYAQAGDEAAFAEVVRRHTDLVYSVALRLVAGDGALAQDVAQTVFTTMARKAGSLSHHANLLGWLHTTTRYAASVAVRGERRRRVHEQEASAMTHDDSPTEMDWAQVQPVLDEAVGRLGEQDREAVLLRFFQNKSHRDVGSALGWNEALSRKRMDRALEKMRLHLARRGVTVSSTLLATTMAANSVHAAPAGLAASLGGASLAGAMQTGLAANLWEGIAVAAKNKIACTAAVVITVAMASLALQYRAIAQTQKENSDLADANGDLRSEMDRLRGQLHTAANGASSTPPPAASAGYLPVSLETTKVLGFVVVDDLKLNPATIALLDLTAEEITQVENVLTETKSRLQAYERSAVREIPFEQVTDPATLNFIMKHPGKKSAYEIPPLSDESLTTLQDGYLGRLTDALGQVRTEILVSKIGGSGPVDFYLMGPGGHTQFVFSDQADPPLTSWAVTFFDAKSPVRWGGRGASKKAFPPEWAFLFKEMRDGKDVEEPPPSPYKTIQSNLHQIAKATSQYMVEKGVTAARYTDVVGTNEEAYMRPLVPVAGESYENIVVRQKDTSVSVEVPGMGVVKYEPED